MKTACIAHPQAANPAPTISAVNTLVELSLTRIVSAQLPWPIMTSITRSIGILVSAQESSINVNVTIIAASIARHMMIFFLLRTFIDTTLVFHTQYEQGSDGHYGNCHTDSDVERGVVIGSALRVDRDISGDDIGVHDVSHGPYSISGFGTVVVPCVLGDADDMVALVPSEDVIDERLH